MAPCRKELTIDFKEPIIYLYKQNKNNKKIISKQIRKKILLKFEGMWKVQVVNKWQG